MRIIEMQAENFKRLRAVSIKPTGNVVEITGDNGEGKTSTLDAIWAALGGKDACPAKPIHSGEPNAEIRLILGDDGEPKFKVTRRFRLKEGVPYATDLTLEGADGGKFGEAQGMLNQLVGQFCFEPMTFLGLPDKDQIATLRRFVPDVDFDAITRMNKRDFDERTEVNRTIRDLGGQIAALPEFEGTVPAVVDISALEQTLATAAEHNGQLEARKARRDATEARVEAIEAQIATLNAERDTLNKQLSDAPPLPTPIDTQRVREQMAEGRASNARRAAAEDRKALVDRKETAEAKSASLTSAIEKRKTDAEKAVRKAKMPIDGLGFAEDAKGDGYVTLNGEPLSQASQAQRIRAAVAVAAAMNPKLRVARIADGSLLDKKSWAALETYAAEHDLQIWVETVSQHGKAAVVIEDGGVLAPQPEEVL